MLVQSSAGNAAAERLWGAGGSSTCPTAPQQILSLLGAAFVSELTQLPEEYPLPGATQPLTGDAGMESLGPWGSACLLPHTLPCCLALFSHCREKQRG